MDNRTSFPRKLLAFFPALIEQSQINEEVHIIGDNGIAVKSFKVGYPNKTESVGKRANYETQSPVSLDSFGPTEELPLAKIVYARSGDKGGNINVGLFVDQPDEYEWLKSFLTTARLKELMADDWSELYFIERVEMPGLKAVHFVVYGILGRGVCSTPNVDNFGKSFADYLRSK